MEKITGSRVVLTIMAITALAMIIIGSMFQHDTLIEWWKPLAFCLLPSGAMGIFLSRVMSRLTKISNTAVNCFTGLAFSFSIFYGGFYILNFSNSESDSAELIPAVVVNRYSREVKRNQRISRYGGFRSNPEMEYIVVLRLDNGTTKQQEVGISEYDNIHVGDTLLMEVQKGMFDVPVIKDLKFPVRYKKRRIGPNIYHRKRL